jgi:hypothetical protein
MFLGIVSAVWLQFNPGVFWSFMESMASSGTIDFLANPNISETLALRIETFDQSSNPPETIAQDRGATNAKASSSLKRFIADATTPRYPRTALKPRSPCTNSF